ncbi:MULTISPECIES: DUF3703 domain-containing protein [Pseudoalteromonas]|uniref:DUF3703 domain-containing protein n=1 Tax=Pseudoalteromonas luteoviolacea (strain 2ta16) TaxID=1353533 RepID=V4H4F8_PSEL2|nr:MULTISPECIES: DUF3703 domain-containing protein [Pseudoalteromonas]ESP92351.1 protein of unknown function (DUF3703) [Pseudoalteromonas luteoviolacea 2ta16]KZN35882.1 hypothetical protein N483_23665 [Pseudoalteromonas luteoviolacea NCIMB 1944]MCG7551440.1 DUF3703 domain-containing protein [Pseudoalteromonas sp. Of7M-16]
MNKELRQAFKHELITAKALYTEGDFDNCFKHLERAHILGQSYVVRHTQSHWWMLKVGFKTGDKREVFGQIMRILASIIFSRIWVPKGNTGGTNVSPFRSMPIPHDLRSLLRD